MRKLFYCFVGLLIFLTLSWCSAKMSQGSELGDYLKEHFIMDALAYPADISRLTPAEIVDRLDTVRQIPAERDDRLRSTAEIMYRGYGDCEDLAQIFLVHLLRNTAVNWKPTLGFVLVFPDNPSEYGHIAAYSYKPGKGTLIYELQKLIRPTLWYNILEDMYPGGYTLEWVPLFPHSMRTIGQ